MSKIRLPASPLCVIRSKIAFKGIARVVHGDSVVLSGGKFFSGLHQTGGERLKVAAMRAAPTARYPMPEITSSKAGVNDVATCAARYGAHAAIPLTFKDRC